MIAFALVGATVCSTLLLHPVHETYCELEWNDDSGCCEVALRVHVLDEQRSRRSITSAETDQWQPDYLRERLFFDPKEDLDSRGKPFLRGRPLRWVGRKTESAHVWWFFEVVCKDGRPPETMQTHLFFDQEQDFRHQVVILGNKDQQGKNPAKVMTKTRPRITLPFLKQKTTSTELSEIVD